MNSVPEYQVVLPRKIDKYFSARIPCFSQRATHAFLCCLGFMIMFGMRESMGIVSSEMASSDINISLSPSTIIATHSAMIWGYFLTKIPGGLLAAAYPANKVFGAAVVSSCLLNSLIPSLYNNPTWLIIVRCMQGLVEGVTFPACHGIMRYWAPPLERSRLSAMAFSGCYAGTLFSTITGDILIRVIGIMAPIYFYSVVGIMWYISWLWLVFEKPSLHTCIDPKELVMIKKSLGDGQQNYTNTTLRSTPWKYIFTSLPCYAIFVANFCMCWIYYLLILFQGMYFKQAFANVGSMSAQYPSFLLMTLVVPAGGILADWLRTKEILNTTQVRKLFNCGGFGLGATFLIGMTFCHTALQGMIVLALGMACFGCAASGFNVNHLDIAPRYASILMGISSGIGNIAGVLVPITKSVIVAHSTRQEWRTLFILSAFVQYGGIIFYGIFASGELQPWADTNAQEEDEMNESAPVMSHTSTDGDDVGVLPNDTTKTTLTTHPSNLN